MTKKVNKIFNLHNATQFVESFDEPANSVYYMLASNHIDWNDDNNPPTPSDSTNYTQYELFDKSIFGKHVTSSDISHMTRRVDWVSGTVYPIYDDKVDLTESNFYVVAEDQTDIRHVFKCINNNSGALSTDKPLGSAVNPSDEIYITNDSYQWKFLYTIPKVSWDKFATTDFMPIIEDVDVTANSVAGALDFIRVDDVGRDYTTYATGKFTDLSVGGNTQVHKIDSIIPSNDFFKNCSIYLTAGAGAGQVREVSESTIVGLTNQIILNTAFTTQPDLTTEYQIAPSVVITGDGIEAEAITVVNTENYSISSISMVNRGQDYTFATAVIQPGLGAAVQDASASVIIGPSGGHGFNVLEELYSDSVCLGVTFANTESGTISTDNDYRTVSILKDPQFYSVDLTLSGISGTFTLGETLTQRVNGAAGVLQSINGLIYNVSEVIGFFDNTNAIDGAAANADVDTVSSTFSTVNLLNEYQVDITDLGLGGTGFYDDESVIQSDTTGATGDLFFQNTSIINLTNTKGNFAISDGPDLKYFTGDDSTAQAKLNGYNHPDLIKYSGEILATQNLSAISRSNSQSETFKFILNF